VDVVEVWTASHACVLQAALRLTNETFAGQLGIAVRTVATWHADPAMVPRAEMQQLLDMTLEQASESSKSRFTLLLRRVEAANQVAPGPTDAQALTVAIAIVIRDSDVLLVCRREDDAAGITWQFPAGVIKPGAPAATVAVRETLAETGVHCTVRRHLGTRVHPLTGVVCEYFLCDYLAGEARNDDLLENVDVTWTLRTSITRFIPADRIFPPILEALEAEA